MGPIDGRSVECVRTPSGKVVSPVVLGQYLFVTHDHTPAVRQYQLIQEAPERVRLLVVPAPEFDEGRRVRLRRDLESLLGEEVAVTVETVSAIPCERSGKRPVIKTIAGSQGGPACR
jgi:hypothetical protein